MSSSSQDSVDLLHWSVQDVLQWLSGLRLSQDYSMVFKEYRVDGHVLSKISHSYLDQLQIFNEKDKIKILQSVSLLRMNMLQKELPALKVTGDTTAGKDVPFPVSITGSLPPTVDNQTDEKEIVTEKEQKSKKPLQRLKIKHKSKSVDDVLNEYSSYDVHITKSLTPTPHFSHVSSHMVDILREENSLLKKELDLYYQKVCRLQKLEQELEHVREAYKLLEVTKSRKEKLELAVRRKLEEELRKYKESSIQQEVQLHTIKRNETFKAAKPDKIIKRELARRDSVIAKLIKQNQNVTTAREQLEKDLYDMKSSLTMANQKENTDNNEEHKEGLKHANENQMAYSYATSVDKLQSILSAMRSSSQKTQQLELQLRKQLEKRVSELQDGSNESMNDENSNEKILTLKADMAKLEHKCLELIAERQFILDKATIPRDTKINQLERELKEKEKELTKCKELKNSYVKQLEESKHKITTLDNRISSLEASLKEKDTLIDTLQSLLEPEDTITTSEESSNEIEPTRSFGSFNRKQSLQLSYNSANRRIRKTSSPLLPPYHHHYPTTTTTTESLPVTCTMYTNGGYSILPSLPTYDEHMQGSLRNGMVGAATGNIGMATTCFGSCSHSFPNTPEVQRKPCTSANSMYFSAPNSNQASPLQRKKPRPISKSLTPPPQKFLQGGLHVKLQTPEYGGTPHVLKHHYLSASFTADAKSLDSDDSLDSLLSPSSPPTAVHVINSPPSDSNKHRHSNSLPNSARRMESSGQYGESHSQDSGVIIEGVYHGNYQL